MPYGSPFNGKGAMLSIQDTRVIFDDSLDVCKEVEKYGVLAYQVRTGHKGKAMSYVCAPLEKRGIQHDTSADLEVAVEYFLEDFRTGALKKKLQILEQQQEHRWQR